MPQYFGRDTLCGICGFRIPLEIVNTRHPLVGTIDHIVPRAWGGANTPSNRQLAHRCCNQQKGARVVMTGELRQRCRMEVQAHFHESLFGNPEARLSREEKRAAAQETAARKRTERQNTLRLKVDPAFARGTLLHMKVAA